MLLARVNQANGRDVDFRAPHDTPLIYAAPVLPERQDFLGTVFCGEAIRMGAVRAMGASESFDRLLYTYRRKV